MQVQLFIYPDSFELGASHILEIWKVPDFSSLRGRGWKLGHQYDEPVHKATVARQNWWHGNREVRACALLSAPKERKQTPKAQ